MTRQNIADGLAARARELAHDHAVAPGDVPLINALADSLWSRFPRDPAPMVPVSDIALTVRGACEIVGHEAIVLEWYKDSENVGTWGIGVTNKSGHNVDRYKDNPQTLEHVIAVYIWLLRNNYIPDVRKAFGKMMLTEHEFTAAVSFHYNTGAILKTDWVKLLLAGKRAEARKFLETHYLNGGDLEGRRMAEAALFFDGKWHPGDETIVWPVKKPSYKPDWSKPKRVDIRPAMEKALAG